ncbi:unnamed protein product [Hermetia illucens]|uniref:Major facilitator superfamily (MFS) profile domain-containing protein n=1 Tax=Hermetia illucens TaxID=343691 RepID=A0A7R8UY11_HERIL|nr:unnamed protein product [Hermetia illucens]
MVFDISVNCPLFGKYRFEFLSALCANIIAIAHGAGIAWLSPTLLLLQSEDTPLASGALDVNEASWLGSLLCVGGFAGNLGFGFIANRWGRKRALSLIAFPQMCFWIIVTFANDIRFLYAGRVLAGMTGGGCFVTIPLYISDIASKEIRGSLGSILMLAVNCGVLVGYSVGSYLPYTVVPKKLHNFYYSKIIWMEPRHHFASTATLTRKVPQEKWFRE